MYKEDYFFECMLVYEQFFVTFCSINGFDIFFNEIYNTKGKVLKSGVIFKLRFSCLVRFGFNSRSNTRYIKNIKLKLPRFM